MRIEIARSLLMVEPGESMLTIRRKYEVMERVLLRAQASADAEQREELRLRRQRCKIAYRYLRAEAAEETRRAAKQEALQSAWAGALVHRLRAVPEFEVERIQEVIFFVVIGGGLLYLLVRSLV